MSYLSAPEVLIMISNDDANHAFASKTKPSVFGSTFNMVVHSIFLSLYLRK